MKIDIIELPVVLHDGKREDCPTCSPKPASGSSGRSGPGSKPQFVSDDQMAENWELAFGKRLKKHEFN